MFTKLTLRNLLKLSFFSCCASAMQAKAPLPTQENDTTLSSTTSPKTISPAPAFQPLPTWYRYTVYTLGLVVACVLSPAIMSYNQQIDYGEHFTYMFCFMLIYSSFFLVLLDSLCFNQQVAQLYWVLTWGLRVIAFLGCVVLTILHVFVISNSFKELLLTCTIYTLIVDFVLFLNSDLLFNQGGLARSIFKFFKSSPQSTPSQKQAPSFTARYRSLMRTLDSVLALIFWSMSTIAFFLQDYYALSISCLVVACLLVIQRLTPVNFTPLFTTSLYLLGSLSAVIGCLAYYTVLITMLGAVSGFDDIFSKNKSLLILILIPPLVGLMHIPLLLGRPSTKKSSPPNT